MKQRLTKIRGHVERLVDLFIALRETVEMLHPLAFDRELIDRTARIGPARKGHLVLQNALLQGCVQDMVRLALDATDTNPSIRNIMEDLEAPEVRQALKADFVVQNLAAGVTDPVIAEALREVEAGEAQERAENFEELWKELSSRWTALRGGTALQGFKVWRDKLIAHADLHHKDGQYRLFDLSELGLKWGDIDHVVAEVQWIVDSITRVVRNASFAFELLETQSREAAEAFWATTRR